MGGLVVENKKCRRCQGKMLRLLCLDRVTLPLSWRCRVQMRWRGEMCPSIANRSRHWPELGSSAGEPQKSPLYRELGGVSQKAAHRLQAAAAGRLQTKLRSRCRVSAVLRNPGSYVGACHQMAFWVESINDFTLPPTREHATAEMMDSTRLSRPTWHSIHHATLDVLPLRGSIAKPPEQCSTSALRTVSSTGAQPRSRLQDSAQDRHDPPYQHCHFLARELKL